MTTEQFKQIKNLLYMIFLLLCMFFGAYITSHAQTRTTWSKYDRAMKIELLTLNGGLLIYASQKQYYIPAQTQKWANWIIYPGVIGFTFYKAIEWKQRKQRPTDIKYPNWVKKI